MPLTAKDVQNVVFQMSKKRNEGYDEDEVDAFLDQVANELDRLTAENDSLRAQLATRPAATPAPAAVAPVVAAPPAPSSGAEQAARVLAAAERTADDVVASARSEADTMLATARSKADNAEREATTKHQATMAALAGERSALEKQVDELRSFEREYRTRLKSYLEQQLRELSARSEGSPPAAPSQPPPRPAATAVPPTHSRLPRSRHQRRRSARLSSRRLRRLSSPRSRHPRSRHPRSRHRPLLRVRLRRHRPAHPRAHRPAHPRAHPQPHLAPRKPPSSGDSGQHDKTPANWPGSWTVWRSSGQIRRRNGSRGGGAGIEMRAPSIGMPVRPKTLVRTDSVVSPAPMPFSVTMAR